MQTSAFFPRFRGGKVTLNLSYTFIYITDKQLFHSILISFSHKKACARPYRAKCASYVRLEEFADASYYLINVDDTRFIEFLLIVTLRVNRDKA